MADHDILQQDIEKTYVADINISGGFVTLLAGDGSTIRVVPIPNFLQEKTYTGIIGTANDAAGASFYYGKIIPTTFYDVWKLVCELDIEAAGRNDAKSHHYITLIGAQSSLVSYASFNGIENTSYRPIYYTNLYRATSAGITNNYGHLLGVGLRSSWNRTTAANARTFTVRIIECVNCTFTFFTDPVKYVNAPGTGATNYSALSELDAYNQGLRETGDDNTYTMLQMTSNYLTNGDTLRFSPYSLFGFDRNGNAQVISLYQAGGTSSTTTAQVNRVYNTAGMDWNRGLFYSNSSGGFAVNSQMAISPTLAHSGIDFRYTDNCVNASTANSLGLVNKKPVFFRGVIKEDGLFYLAPIEVTYNNTTYKRAWTQNIPTAIETDGTYQYVYWLIGYPYYNSSYPNSLYQMNLFENNPMYWYHNGRFEVYVENAASADQATILKNSRNFSIGSASKTFNGSANVSWTVSTEDVIKTITFTGGSDTTLGTAISADDITAWDAGSTPTLGTAIPADDITAWNAGTLPTLGTSFSVPNVTRNDSVAASKVTKNDSTVVKTISQAASTSSTIGTVSNGVLTLSQAITAVGAVTVDSTATASAVTITDVTATNVTLGTVFSIPNITGVGTLPSLSYTAKSIPNITSVGSLPTLTFTPRSIPNITAAGTAPTLTTTTQNVITGIS